MKTSEVLKQARGLLAREGGRCTEVFYEAGGGTVSYCAVGAVAAAVGHTRPGVEAIYAPGVRPALVALCRAVNPGHDSRWPRSPIYEFNDSHETGEVLALFTRAIAIAEAEEQEHSFGSPLPDLEPAETDLATVRAAIAAHDAREAGDSRLLAAIREATGTRVDEDERRAAA